MRYLITLLSLVLLSSSVHSQVAISGRVWMPKPGNSGEMHPFKAIYAFGTPVGTGYQTAASRTWEMEPAGWYRITGSAGCYAIAYSTPGKAVRPVVLNNVYTRPGDSFDINATPSFDYAIFDESEWDKKPAKEYYQIFTAKGASITGVGFKLVHDGVDGGGPGSQTMLVSVYRKGSSKGTPDTWKQVGPTMTVLNVDCGDVKSYDYSANWDSGEVQTVPGETYAVRLSCKDPSGKMQAYWKSGSGCYRVSDSGSEYAGKDLWMMVASDSDGLVIPYNKRVQKDFVGETRFGKKWTQTYVAKGRSLASVILYAATSGIQPGLPRQRVAVRVREGGPDGPLAGIEKIAIGAGNFTGDASWGVFGAAYAPGEVSLVPGKTYAIEFESIENLESLHGYVNIKGMKSDDIPGFHPCPKVAPDTYPKGRAYFNGKEPTDYDLDMQVVEYEKDAPAGWSKSVEKKNLLRNGDMAMGDLNTSKPDFWEPWSLDQGTLHQYVTELDNKDDRFLRVLGGSATGKTVDGGWVQRIEGLSPADTYILNGKVRSSWLADAAHECCIGYDSTGQTQDPKASSIVWKTFPPVHGIFASYESEPIRPVKDSVSVWLRGKTTMTGDFLFKADFDDFALRKVRTAVF